MLPFFLFSFLYWRSLSRRLKYHFYVNTMYVDEFILTNSLLRTRDIRLPLAKQSTPVGMAVTRHSNLISGMHRCSRRWLKKSRTMRCITLTASFVAHAMNPSMNPLKSGSSCSWWRTSLAWMTKEDLERRDYHTSEVENTLANAHHYIVQKIA